MRLTDSNIEMLEDNLRHLHMSGELQPEDHNWYLVGSELVRLYKEGEQAIRRLQSAKEEVQFAEKHIQNIRIKENNLVALYEKLNAERLEREAQSNAEPSGK
jgi:hypothetical protein